MCEKINSRGNRAGTTLVKLVSSYDIKFIWLLFDGGGLKTRHVLTSVCPLKFIGKKNVRFFILFRTLSVLHTNDDAIIKFVYLWLLKKFTTDNDREIINSCSIWYIFAMFKVCLFVCCHEHNIFRRFNNS